MEPHILFLGELCKSLRVRPCATPGFSKVAKIFCHCRVLFSSSLYTKNILSTWSMCVFVCARENMPRIRTVIEAMSQVFRPKN